MRVCTRFRRDGTALPGDVPAYPGFPFAMISRVMGARIAMLFGR
jgi:hypothetical protein